MSYLGDFPEDGIVDFKFSTNDAAGGSIAIGSPSGAISVYIGNSLTQLTAGVTLTENFDGLVGIHHVRIDLSASASYVAGSECQVVLAGADIDGQAVNAVLREFSIGRTLAPNAVQEIVDAVWDEVLTAATHNVASSAGRRLRQLADVIVHSGTAQGPGTGTDQIQLDVGASATDGAYDPAVIAIVGGTGAGQCRLILQYAGATRTATVDRDWKVNPDATSVFQITANPGREHVNEGLAQAGGASTITLNALASSADETYVGQLVFLRAGTGADQVGVVTAYNGTTKVATIDPPWSVVPDATTAYAMLPSGPVLLASVVHTGATIPTVTEVTGLTASDVGAIKAKTDQLTFTAGNVNANIDSVIGSQVQENGSASTNWGAAP